jgi:hypothetical protein
MYIRGKIQPRSIFFLQKNPEIWLFCMTISGHLSRCFR